MLTLPVSLWALQQIVPVFFKQRHVHGGGKAHDEFWASRSLQEENNMVVEVPSSLILVSTWGYFHRFS